MSGSSQGKSRTGKREAQMFASGLGRVELTVPLYPELLMLLDQAGRHRDVTEESRRGHSGHGSAVMVAASAPTSSARPAFWPRASASTRWRLISPTRLKPRNTS